MKTTKTASDFRTFVDSYISSLYWLPLEEEPGVKPGKLAFRELREVVSDCRGFWFNNPECHHDPARAGHDFYLTRNRHGAGFWDGDWKDGEKLTEAAHTWGSQFLMVARDGSVSLCS